MNYRRYDASLEVMSLKFARITQERI